MPLTTGKPDLRNPCHLLASGFGSGLAPWAPGTCGTLAAVVLWWPLQTLGLSGYLTVLTAAIVLGIPVCGRTAADLKVHDHSSIVWDEFCGFWLTMLAAPAGVFWVVTGFVLFRLFDILKPWPIRLLDQKVTGGLGIMLDDLAAGGCALAVLQLLVAVIR